MVETRSVNVKTTTTTVLSVYLFYGYNLDPAFWEVTVTKSVVLSGSNIDFSRNFPDFPFFVSWFSFVVVYVCTISSSLVRSVKPCLNRIEFYTGMVTTVVVDFVVISTAVYR